MMSASTSGVSNLFEPRAILTHRKYCWVKQTKHPIFCPKIIVISKKMPLPEVGLTFPTFCPEIMVISKKKQGPHLKSVSDFPLFVPKS